MEPLAPSLWFLDGIDTIKEKKEELIEKEYKLKTKEKELECKRQHLEKSPSKDKALHNELVWEVNKLKRKVNMWEQEDRMKRA